MNLREYQKLKDQADRAQREADKAAGSLRTLLDRLQKEHGVNSVEEGEKLLEKLQKETVQLEAEAEAAMLEWKKEWGDKLNG